MNKIIENKRFIDEETGEITEFSIMQQNGDFNFEKIWLGHLMQTLDIIGNQKIKVITHIISNRIKSNNMFIGSQREIAQDIGVSLKTVSLTIQALKEAGFLKEIKKGLYQVNPDYIFKGAKGNRMNIVLQYNNIKK